MRFIYNCSVYIVSFFLELLALFSPKLRLFVKGRKNIFSYLNKNINSDSKVIWVHAASLGEFEQGLPVIEKLKLKYPIHKILITFFSPSGYEVKKNTPVADFVTYLPLDTKKNAEKFIHSAKPELAIFVKYEIWPNYLSVLKDQKIPTLLISALFSKKQIFFKSYGTFMKKSLAAFTHFFVQDENSKQLLHTLNFNNISVSGDTRFDRVLEILESDNYLEFIARFKGEYFCLVAGSTWPEDESILINFINSSTEPIKYILAPHAIKKEAIKNLASSIHKKTILYSELKNQDLSKYDVFIIDTIGILTKIYSYANIAYVGGGFETGLHNTLEPAVFGIPVLIGPKFIGFKEAEELVAKKGIIVIKDTNSFTDEMSKLLNSSEHYNTTSEINKNYISKNQGATNQILSYIEKLLYP